MSTGKIERTAVTAVVDYLDKVDKFEPFISYSDKAPITDGYFNIYKNEQQKVENFFAQIPVQVKGTASDKDYYFRIGREHVDAYVKLGGIVFFKVIVDQDCKKILYAILSTNKIDELLTQSTKQIKIDLEEVPEDHEAFERDIFAFASMRNGEKVEDSSLKEIADLVKGFEKIRGYLGEIEDNDVKIELELYLDSIKDLKADDTIGWRDKFILYSRKALDLAAANIKEHDIAYLQFQFGAYLHKQKQYQLVEDYYLNTLEAFRKRGDTRNVAAVLDHLATLHYNIIRYKEAEQEYQESLKIYRDLANENPDVYNESLARVLNNLAALHFSLTCYEAAEKEHKEALKIRRELANKNPNEYFVYVAMSLNNLAVLHKNLNRFIEAEQEYQDALYIYRILAKNYTDRFIEDVAQTLNNLAVLYHQGLERYDEAEMKYLEALEIRRRLAEKNSDAYKADVAMTLSNLAALYSRCSVFEAAAKVFKEALAIYRELAKKNSDAYDADVSMTLNNLAILHGVFNCNNEAEQEYKEALEIRRGLAKKYPDAFIGDVANTLYNYAQWLQKDEKRQHEAKAAANEALGIYKELAKKYPQLWSKEVKDTQRLLDELQKPNPPA